MRQSLDLGFGFGVAVTACSLCRDADVVLVLVLHVPEDITTSAVGGSKYSSTDEKQVVVGKKERSCRGGGVVGGRWLEVEDQGEEKVTNGEGRQIWKDDTVVEGSRRRETEEALRGAAAAVSLRNKVGLLWFLLRRV